MPSCPMVRDSREQYRALEGAQYQAARESPRQNGTESEQRSDVSDALKTHAAKQAVRMSACTGAVHTFPPAEPEGSTGLRTSPEESLAQPCVGKEHARRRAPLSVLVKHPSCS